VQAAKTWMYTFCTEYATRQNLYGKNPVLITVFQFEKQIPRFCMMKQRQTCQSPPTDKREMLRGGDGTHKILLFI
jgi:hypothetical protein